MRCPHCRGEIPNESQFCGVCGQNVHISQVGSPPVQQMSVSGASQEPSLFDLPVSNGARVVRVGLAVALNLAMLGAGVALTLGYLDKRENAAQAASVTKISAPQNSATEHSGTEGTALGTDASTKDRPSTAISGTRKIDSLPSGPSGNNATPSSPNPGAVDAGASGSGSSSSGPSSSGSSSSGSSSSGSSSTRPTPTPTRPIPPDASPASSPVRSPDAGVSAPPLPGNVMDAGLGQVVPPPLSAEEQQREVQLLAGKIGLVVERHQTQLSRCYENALKQTNPNDSEPLAGRINIHFSVQPNGSATGIRVQSNNTGSPSLAKCLVGLVGSWAFPSSGSEALDFVWPFEFQAP